MAYVKKTKPKVKTNVKLEPREPWELCAVRHNLGLTADDLGEIMGLNRKVIYQIEQQKLQQKSSSLKLYSLVLEAICKEQGSSFDEVLAGEFLS